MYNVSKKVWCGMELCIDLNCILRIYSATPGYNVVLYCIMIKVTIEGYITPLKGGGRGAYRRAYSTEQFMLRCKGT